MGSGYKQFTAGAVLTASEVNNYLMEQSVMTFAGSAARGSAIGTANYEEGMTSYLQDTDKLEVYNGTNWVSVAPTSTQGLTLINTTSFSGAVSHSFGSDASPIFTSAYRNYRIVFDNLQVATSNQSLNLRLRANTTDLTGANYDRQSISAGSTTITGTRNASATSYNIGDVGHSGSDRSSIIVDVMNPQTLFWTTFLANSQYTESGTGIRLQITSAFVSLNNAYNGFTIFAGTNVSGNLAVYGYNI